MKLIIVESPNKAKTISQFIPNGYIVKASIGHIRNLPKNEIAIDFLNSFKPKWQVEKGKQNIINDIKSLSQKAEVVYMATDPDREGEAIAWHLMQVCKIPNSKLKRAEMHELSEKAVMKAIKESNPWYNKAYAQAGIARRIIDRMIGYVYSPFIMFKDNSEISWSKIKTVLSFGRVQTPTLRLVVEREREIRNFKPEKYYTVSANLSKDGFDFKAEYEKWKKFKTKEEANKIVEKTKWKDAIVVDFKEEIKKIAPPPPLTTSNLLKTANKVFGFKSDKTMNIAQDLFETWYISYHRTDSKHLSDETKKMVSQYIKRVYWDKYVLASGYSYKKQAWAQEAHESIHPINIDICEIPLGGRKWLTEDHNKIYKMIHDITVASIMKQQEVKVKSVTFDINGHKFFTIGKQIIFDGFSKVWGSNTKDQLLPEIKKGDKVTNKKINLEEKQTTPPARYNESSLIKKMEVLNIGRPSTYASIIKNIADRKYIRYDKKTIYPTEIGEKLVTYCERRLPKFVDYKFTSELEQWLDEIANDRISIDRLLDFTFAQMKKELQMNTEEIIKMTSPRNKK